MSIGIGINLALQHGSRAAGAAGVPWWLAGGIDPASVVAVYQPLGAASLAASYIDVSGNGNDISLGVAPTFDGEVGWTFDGSTQYLNTGVVPDNDQTWSMIVRYNANSVAGFRCMAGCTWKAGNFGFAVALSGTAERRYYNGRLIAVATSGIGEHVMAVAGNQGYFDGVADGGTIASDADANSYSIHIGGLNNQGSTTGFFNGSIQGVAIYDSVVL